MERVRGDGRHSSSNNCVQEDVEDIVHIINQDIPSVSSPIKTGISSISRRIIRGSKSEAKDKRFGVQEHNFLIPLYRTSVVRAGSKPLSSPSSQYYRFRRQSIDAVQSCKQAYSPLSIRRQNVECHGTRQKYHQNRESLILADSRQPRERRTLANKRGCSDSHQQRLVLSSAQNEGICRKHSLNMDRRADARLSSNEIHERLQTSYIRKSQPQDRPEEHDLAHWINH